MRARAGVAILAAVLIAGAGGAARPAAGEPVTTTIAATTSTATAVTTTTTTLPTGAAAGSTTTAESTSTTAEGSLAAGATSTTTTTQAGLPPGQSISITPESGPPGTVVTLEVTGCIIGGWSANWTIVFVSSTSFRIDSFGEVAADGSYSVRFAIPDVPPGRVDIGFMCGVDDAVTGPPGVDFTVTEGPSSGIGGPVSVSPASGPPGTVMTVRASGCALDGQPATYSRLQVVHDLDELVIEDFGVADSTGAFSGTFVVPDWEPGRAGMLFMCAVGDIALPQSHLPPGADPNVTPPLGFEITAATPPTPVVVRPDYTG